MVELNSHGWEDAINKMKDELRSEFNRKYESLKAYIESATNGPRIEPRDEPNSEVNAAAERRAKRSKCIPKLLNAIRNDAETGAWQLVNKAALARAAGVKVDSVKAWLDPDNERYRDKEDCSRLREAWDRHQNKAGISRMGGRA
jgi:hypothetical protein